MLVGRHARLDAVLSLDDRLSDVAGGSFDAAIRIGGLAESATMLKLADNRRVLTAAPAYLDGMVGRRCPPTFRPTASCDMATVSRPGCWRAPTELRRS